MTPRTRSRLLRLAFAVIAALLWAGAVMVAMPPGINDGPSGACVDAWDERVVVFDASVIPESVAVDGAWQLFPLGVGCRYTAPTGESVFIAPSLVPSVIGFHALAFTAVLIAALVRDSWSTPRARDDLRRA